MHLSQIVLLAANAESTGVQLLAVVQSEQDIETLMDVCGADVAATPSSRSTLRPATFAPHLRPRRVMPGNISAGFAQR